MKIRENTTQQHIHFCASEAAYLQNSGSALRVQYHTFRYHGEGSFWRRLWNYQHVGRWLSQQLYFAIYRLLVLNAPSRSQNTHVQ